MFKFVEFFEVNCLTPSLDRAHMILDEIILNGDIVETSKATILEPVALLDKYTKKNT